VALGVPPVGQDPLVDGQVDPTQGTGGRAPAPGEPFGDPAAELRASGASRNGRGRSAGRRDRREPGGLPCGFCRQKARGRGAARGDHRAVGQGGVLAAVAPRVPRDRPQPARPRRRGARGLGPAQRRNAVRGLGRISSRSGAGGGRRARSCRRRSTTPWRRPSGT
jgi:hypothetical protein